MQAPTQTQATAAPAAARSPIAITTVGQDGKTQTIRIPRTQSDVDALQAQREEISDQLTSVSSRRRELAEEIQQTAVDAVRPGLQERLRLLDNRILQLESDLGVIGRQLSAAPAELTAETEVRSGPMGADTYEEGVVIGAGSMLAFGVLVLFARRRWRRSRAGATPQLRNESAERLARLEHGMEAIAIEIERVSEGQRFVTKLLSESQSVPAEQRR
ncbi:MAG TPA: hypothetical protein VM053_12285 [Gemmatimonadaceae bacterium]|nr:hypothetical protein [Gemmatimonadaceae bacterium]